MLSHRSAYMSNDADRHPMARASRTHGRRPAPSLVLAIALSVAGSAHAATVNALQGQVLVNSGQGYRLVDGSTQVPPGGTVVANPGAIAHVVYAGGCRVTVEPGSVYPIAYQPPCQTGGPTQTGSLTSKADKGQTSTSSWGVNPWLLGGLGLAAGGGAAYLVTSMSP
jgi:hypothetical protein